MDSIVKTALFTPEECIDHGAFVMPTRTMLEFQENANFGMVAVQVVLILSLMLLFRAVYQIVGWNDKSMLAMIFFLNL